MIKETCPHCNNIVVGEFTPSSTRKWLTTVAKKGGMKGVLTVAGSVIPGFGNVAGFIAGTAIDVMYGKDINKLVDYVADQFDDNKVYVFSCPNCGHIWTQREGYGSEYSQDYGYIETTDLFSVNKADEDLKIEFNDHFNDFIAFVKERNRDAVFIEERSEKMRFLGDSIECCDKVRASQYYFLGGLYNLIYAIDHFESNDVEKELKRASDYLLMAIHLLSSSEYILIWKGVCSLRCQTPEECVKEGTAVSKYWLKEESTIFNREWLTHVYEQSRWLSILRADDIITDAEDGTYPDELLIELWKTGIDFENKNYRMVSNVNLFDLIKEFTPAGKISMRSARALNEAFDTEGYSIATCDAHDYFQSNWLEACVWYAASIVEDSNPYKPQNIEQGMKMIFEVSEFDKCYAGSIAQELLGNYYEKGIGVQQNVSKALFYYKKSGCEEGIKRLMQQAQSKPNDYDESKVSTNETEYIEELKACYEKGQISKVERRLLEKLRIKLDISEIRAIEIENTVVKQRLTDAEREYLDEYRECMSAGGVLSPIERRLLEKLRIKFGISESRATELEGL